MCIQTRIQRILEEKAALDAQVQKLEQLEIKTAPIKTLLSELLADYSDVAPEDLASIWQEILAIGSKFNLSPQPLTADELKQWEATNAENERLREEARDNAIFWGAVKEANEKLKEQLEEAHAEITEQDRAWGEISDENDDLKAAPEPETIESILKAKGFFETDHLEDYDDKYETYRGWDVYYSFPNGGIVSIGLYSASYNQAWDVSTEYIQEIDPTFPESLADSDEIVKWTRALIDQVENLQVPGQLALEFSETTPEPTKLQKLLEGNSNFTFEELGISVAIESVIAPADDTVDYNSEEVQITVCNSTGGTRKYYESAQTFVYQHSPENLEQAALGYARFFLQELEKEAKIKEKVGRWNADETLASNKSTPEPIAESATAEPAGPETETNFEALGFTVSVHPQYTGENLVGATFRFFSQTFKGADGNPKLVFSTSQLPFEIGDRTWKICACDLIRDWRDKEATRLEKLANPHATEEDKFVELVKLTPAVGYIKRRDNGELISAYAAFANRDTAGEKTETLAKPRAKKWKEFWHSSFESCGWKVEEPRKVKRMQSEPGAKQQFAYEIKISGKFSIGQLQKLAEEDFSLLPNEIAATKPAEPVTTPAPIYRVIVNGFEMASGKGNEVLSRFEEELVEFGDAGKTSVSLMRGSEVVERYAVADFDFVEAQDFDAENPEYFVLHRPTKTNFRVYRSLASGLDWINSIYPYRPNLFNTKEAAAVDGVRRKLKAEKAK
ncbi:hypothetical protein [Microcoleus sp. D2_18a_B4]|uniref:hypothetical protein n=1 Tax=Microcoleus sp. D2_18a_B4 TaxID=3055329 RepID=UPI002FD6BD60